MFGLRNLSEIGKLPAGLRDQLEAEGVIFTAGKVGISRHFSGHVPGVFSSSGVSRYSGGFGFSAARVVATFPARGDANLRSIDCAWDSNKGPATATITSKGLVIEIALHGVDPAFSGTDEVELQEEDPRRGTTTAAGQHAAFSGRAGFRLPRRRGAPQITTDVTFPGFFRD